MINSNNYLKKILFVSLLIIILSLALRIDLGNSYPKGVDTYTLYSLAKDVQEKNYVVWNVDFATSIGITSVSYPPGGIVFLAEISSISGLNITDSILIWNIFLIIIAALIVYLTSQEIFDNKITSLLVVLIYLNTRFFISYSTFYTPRNILHIFFLAIIFFIIKKIDAKNIFLVAFILLIAFFTHRSTILLVIFLIAFIISKYYYRFYKNTRVQNLSILFLGIFMFLISIYFFGHSNIGSETTRIPLSINMPYADDLLSILFSISMHFGILTIILPLGYYFLITKKEKSQNDLFILISITLSAGFIVETIYFFYLFLPILAYLVGYFLKNILLTKSMPIKDTLIILIIISLIIPIYITVIQSKSDVLFVRDQTIRLKDFLDGENLDKSIICNYHTIYCSQISSLSSNTVALTDTSVRLFMDRISISESKLNIYNIRNKIIVKDNILKTPIFPDSYNTAIINWNIPLEVMNQLIDFTNLGYIIDSDNSDSVNNRVKMNEKFGRLNQIYDNGLQQVKEI